MVKKIREMGKDGNMKELLKLRREKKAAESKNRIKDQAEYCNAIGTLLFDSGDFDGALEEHQEELTLCEALGDIMGQAVAHRRMGEVFCELGQHQEALLHHKRFLEAAQHQNDRLEIQRATATVGRTYLLMADSVSSSQDASKQQLLEKAQKWFQKSLHVVPSVTGVSERERAEMLARLHLNLGIVAESNDKTEEARASYKKAAAVTEQFGLHEDGRRVHDSLALSLQRTGDYRQALQHLDTSLRLSERLQDRAGRADTLSTRAQVLLQMGDVEAASRAWYRAYKLKSPRPEDHARHASCLRNAVLICRADDQLQLLDRQDHQRRYRLHEKLADRFCRLSAYEPALRHYRAQLECAEAMGRPESAKASIYASLAETHKDLRQYAEAKTWYLRELEARRGNRREVCKTLLNLASLEASMGGDVSSVCAFYREAADEASVEGLSRLRATALRDMAETYRENGLLEDAARVRRDLALALRCDGLPDDFDEAAGSSGSPSEQDDSSSEHESLDLDRLEDMSSGSEADQERPPRARAGRDLWRNNKGETHLHVACIQGRHKQVARLLQAGHPVNVRDYSGWLPLHEAANFGHLAAVRLLLERGARVNDPGGQHCGGITPLHDAAGNGHVAVARSLLAAGADPTARNQEGDTPLDYLMSYRAKAAAEMTPNELEDAKQLEAEMKEAFRKGGLPVPASPSCRLERSRSARTSGTAASAEDPASESPGPPPPAALLSDEEDGMDTYRRAIRGVGQSAVSAPPAARYRGRRASPGPARAGLVDESEYQWLEEDVAPQPSRRRRLSPVFAAAAAGGRGRRRPVSPLGRPPDPPSAGGPSPRPAPESPGRSPGSPRRSPASPARSEPASPPPPTPEPEVEIVEEASDGEPTPARPPPARRSRKRPRQTRLTPLLMRDRQKRPVEMAQEDPPDSLSPTLPSKVQRAGGSGGDQAWQVPTLRVFVEVDRDRLMVPVPVANTADSPPRTVAWLAREASDRYYRQFLLRPQLELLKDGAVLTLDDAVAGLVRGQDDVIGSRVISWERPPLAERYASACGLLSERVIGAVSTGLSLCQSSGRLDLADLCLTPERLRPVLRACQRYSCIAQLKLAGNPLKDGGVQEVSGALLHLTGLSTLDLSCVKMTAVGLGHLAAAVSGQGVLQSCETLRLAYNLLQDVSAGDHLARLVAGLPRLACLDLSSCQLTEQHLSAHQDRLTPALANCSLSELRLAHNRMPASGAQLLLRCLRPDWLLRLSLSGWRAAPAPLCTYAAAGRDCALQQLELRHCGLTDDQADQLASVLVHTPHLTRLDLSGNGRLGAAAAARLLSAALSAGCPLTELLLAGCRPPAAADWPPAPLGALLRRWLAAPAPPLRLTLPLPAADQPDLAPLSRPWTERWAERAAIGRSPDGDVRLEVCDA